MAEHGCPNAQMYVPDFTATEENAGLLCGEACLTMLLRWLGISCSLNDIYRRTIEDQKVLQLLDNLTKANVKNVSSVLNGIWWPGTPCDRILCAATQLGAHGSKYCSITREKEARAYLSGQGPLPIIAIVSPTKLCGGDPGAQPWAHAVVVVETRDETIVYHDPDQECRQANGSETRRPPLCGGPNQSTSVQDFLAAWEEWRFVSIDVRI